MYLISQYPTGIFTCAVFLLTTLAHNNVLMLILDLTVLLAYAPIILNRTYYQGMLLREGMLLLSLVLGQAVAYWGVATSTSQGFQGIGALCIPEYAVVRASVLLSHFVSRRYVAKGWDLFVFPAVWATAWQLMSLWPLGRLLAWSPTPSLPGYDWLLPIFGPSGHDWVVAAWAVVLYQHVTSWYMGPHDTYTEDSELIKPPNTYANAVARHSTAALTVLLLGLALPSLHFASDLYSNLELSPRFVDGNIPLTVGCVLPRLDEVRHTQLTLDDYISESQRLTASTRVLLWPETAVLFHNETERLEAFDRIRTQVLGSVVGVSFEEIYRVENDVQRRRGLAVISHWSDEPHLMYYKQHLVPLVESFPLTAFHEKPSLAVVEARRPNWMHKKEWQDLPDYSRELTVTGGICLDLAFPDLLTHLHARPSLILAPANTWHETVGRNMWEQAVSRAAELGSHVLWCDGGQKSFSGVGSAFLREPMQQGPGSWTRTILVQNRGQTFYSKFNWMAMIWSWVLAGGGCLAKVVVPFSHLIRRVTNFRRGTDRDRDDNDDQPLLLEDGEGETPRDLLA